ncbi:MAG: hypothetical protein QOD03_4 [Verrucomicrobiota bacterium]
MEKGSSIIKECSLVREKSSLAGQGIRSVIREVSLVMEVVLLVVKKVK